MGVDPQALEDALREGPVEEFSEENQVGDV